MTTDTSARVGGAPDTAGTTSGELLAHVIAHLAWLGLFSYTLVTALAFPQIVAIRGMGPGTWPAALSTIGIGLTAASLVLILIRRSPIGSEAPRSAQGLTRLSLTLICLVGYGVLWYFVDFRISTLVLFVALVWVGGGRGWRGLVLFPVISTAVLWFFFGFLLRVPL
ncbi:MAG: tripartite tricarboxylate transporter TctB family protein [Beutenbergiaceae bacterium]